MSSELVPVLCPSCGTRFHGKYCSQCGEKKRSPDVFSISHFIEESVEGFTHFDNKFFRTVRLLFAQPGALTDHFENGRRVPFMKPVQLFVICNLLYFLFSGGFNVFTIPFENYLRFGNFTSYGTVSTYNEIVKTSTDPDSIGLIFDEKVVPQSKAFIFVFIPFIALACYLLFFKRKRFFALHLIFATYFFTFLLLLFMLFGIFVELPNRHLFHISPRTSEIISLSVILPVMYVYLLLAIRRYYRIKWVFAILSSLVLILVFIQLLQFYRIGLFYKIIYSIG